MATAAVSARVRGAQWRWALGLALFVTLAVAAVYFLPDLIVRWSLTGGPWPSDELFEGKGAPRFAEPADYVSAVATTRAALLLLAGGGVALVTLYLSRVRDAVAEDKHDIERDAVFTDRYVDAARLLGDNEPAVRIAGLYALERLAGDSPKDAQTVVDVIVGFIRERAERINGDAHRAQVSRPSADLDAAYRALARLTKQRRSQHRIIFRDRSLAYAPLSDANLSGANLHNANFTQAYLNRADLSETNIERAVFADANLRGTDLRGAKHSGAQQFAEIYSWDDDTKWPDGLDTSGIEERKGRT